MSVDIIIIGAGPAGMMAAYSAAMNGASVMVLDRNQAPGKKLLITGKGRCNVTNNCDRETLMNNVAVNGKFLFSAFSSFTSQDTMDFFEGRGVPLKTERGNRVFPVSDRASDINNALISACREAGVSFVQAYAESIKTDNGRVTAVTANGIEYPCRCCVLAAGGMSYKATGSDGNGYRLAEKAGHTIITPKPSLVPVVCNNDDCASLQGLSLKNVALTVTDGKGKVRYTDFGELLFTHFGLSGPMVLSASSHIRFDSNETYTFSIDMKPALDDKQLDARLVRDFTANTNKNFDNSLGALLPRKLIPIVVRRSGIPFDTKVNTITKEQRNALKAVLKALTFTATGFRPINEAIITSGGVNVREINPKTMRSKLVNGLYFAGEIIDVDAHTGGFNLQIAFSTGYAAGQYSAMECFEND